MTLFLILSLLSATTSLTANKNCEANANGEFRMKVNYHTANLKGEFEVEGCTENSPVIEMRRGVTYTFVQHDISNWMHPIGFAYYQDGEHGYGKFDEGPELEYPTSAACDSPDFKCNPGSNVKQAPLYGIDGVFETFDDWNNGVISGLDVYEPGFRVPQEQWIKHKYAVKITVPKESKTKEFFYFCHLHSGISGLIKVVDHVPDANPLIQPFDPNTYYPKSNKFDTMCGTSGVSKYNNRRKYCPGQSFLCGRVQNPTFARCMKAIDCHMNYEMSVHEDPNPLVVFMHQMIPHHINAVNMARIALKHSTQAAGYYDDTDLDVPGLMRAIITSQNLQIQEMRKWLKNYGPDSKFCPLRSGRKKLVNN